MKNKFLFTIITLSLSIVVLSIAQESKTYTLQYKYQKGDRLQYKIERHDSINTSFGDQDNQIKSTRWSLQSITVPDISPGKLYNIVVKTDSTWSDQDNPFASSQGGMTTIIREEESSGGSRRMTRTSGGGHGRRGRVNSYKMTSQGKSTTKEPIMSSLILPLPDKPVAVNATWNFEKISEQKGQRKGKTVIKGQCLLYDVQKEGGKSIALIIVNSETNGNIEFKMQTSQGSFSGSSVSKGSETSLVYFEIEKGRIIEIIKEETTSSINEMSMGSSSMSSSSKSTIKLISE